MLRIKRIIFVVASLTTVSFLVACERSTHVRIRGPEFAQKAKTPWDEDLAVWKITVADGRSTGTPVGSLDQIVYGVLPEGYMQVRPKIGSAPPLKEGEKYFYEVTTTNAPGARGYFGIKNSRAVSTNGPPGPCFGGEGKEWVRVPCP